MPLFSLFTRISIALLLLFIVRLPVRAAAEPNWPLLSFTQVASGLEFVVDIQNAADGSNRLFFVQQRGKIRILKNGALLPTPLLDLSGKVAVGDEQGLLGLAFPPAFTQKKCFYVYYCRLSDGATILSRFKMSSDANVADSTSETILLINLKTQTNHNGGQLAFGPDGYLYISTGDGGGQGDPNHNSQNLTNRLGKILRIDVEHTSTALGLPYAIPASNPFATSSSNAKEILYWGLRNPWRFSFDSLTGDLFIGDVGENLREEINFVSAASINNGTNFGWSVKEGTLDYTAQANVTGTLQPPIYEYPHAYGFGYSVTGGYMYRGVNPRLQGFYLFGDFQSGRIWAMESPSAGGRVLLLKETFYSFSTFGKDEAGEIYVADYVSGKLFRFDAPDTLPAPVVSGGTDQNGVYFKISTDSPGAVIHYTTDGTPPDENSPVYTPGTLVRNPNPLTLKTAAYRSDLNPSPVVVNVYQLRIPEVTIVGNDTNFSDYTTIRLTNPMPNIEIHYTLDGSGPSQNSPLYSTENGVLVDHSLQLRAVATKPENGWIDSPVSSRYFYLTAYPPQLATYFSDIYDPISFISLTPGAVYHYTIDGTTPTLQSPIWHEPQYLPANSHLKVLSSKGQMDSSLGVYELFRVSQQKTRFEKMAPGPSSYPQDVVHTPDSTFYSVDYYGKIWKLSSGEWTLLYQGDPGQSFSSVCLTPAGNLAVADAGKMNIIQFQPPFTAAGAPWGTNSASIQKIIALPAGGFLFTDSSGRTIQKITSSNTTTIFAGGATTGGADGPVLQATFDGLTGITRNVNGDIFATENSGHRIRRIGTDNMVTTVAGNGQQAWTDGPKSDARFSGLVAVVMDRIGNLYVSDRGYVVGKIRKIRPDGMVTTLRGPIYQTGTDTILTQSSFGPDYPSGLDVDENGVLYIVNNLPGGTVMKATQEDWDNDGIPDATEVALGAPFVVGVDDRLADADGDHFSNCAEWIAGTNPLVATSQPTERTQIQLKDGTVTLNLPCEPGKTTQLEYSDDLQNWKPMGVPSASAFRSFAARFVAPQFTGQRFYRLRSIP